MFFWLNVYIIELRIELIILWRIKVIILNLLLYINYCLGYSFPTRSLTDYYRYLKL